MNRASFRRLNLRLAQLEAAHTTTPEVMVVVLRIVEADGSTCEADCLESSDGRSFSRLPRETLAAFEERAIAEARRSMAPGGAARLVPKFGEVSP